MRVFEGGGRLGRSALGDLPRGERCSSLEEKSWMEKVDPYR